MVDGGDGDGVKVGMVGTRKDYVGYRETGSLIQ